MGKVIGIDLGTTNSCVAIMEGKNPKVIENEEGSRTTPSVVAFAKDDERLVGISARRQAVINPEGTIYSAKRFMGMRFSEAKSEVESVPYKVSYSKSGACKIKVGKKSFTPQQISAQVLSKIKKSAERYLGQEVSGAVITVPAYFNDDQRQATKDAGKIAGLDVLRIINEPTAAALAYGIEKSGEQKVAVFDLGGGTFDISILEISEGVVEVLSTNGDTHLGGDDVDKLLMNWMFSEFKNDTGIDLSSDSMVIQRVREAAEKAKIELSSTNKTEINLPFLTADSSGPKHLVTSLTRSKFNQMIESFVSSTLSPIKNALNDAGLKKSDIDEIIMVGGSTRIPAVRNSVEEYFGKASNNSVNPDEVVALGAAIQAGIISGDVNDILLLDVTPLSLGIETLGGVSTTLIPRNTTIPVAKSEIFSTAADNQSSVDIVVLQGERKFSSDNRTLGRLQLSDIPPAPRGIPQIEVRFDIDVNGIISVSAKDKATGKEQTINITGNSGLSEEEIDSMVKEAEAFSEEDSAKIKIIEQRNKLDTLVYQSQSFLSSNREKIDISAAESLESQIEKSREALENDERLEEEFSKLESSLHSAAATMNNESENIGEESDEDTIDVEFEEI